MNNKITLIICSLLLVIMVGFTYYHEVYLMGKAVSKEELGIFIVLAIGAPSVYYLLKKGYSPLAIKVLLIVILGGFFLILSWLDIK